MTSKTSKVTVAPGTVREVHQAALGRVQARAKVPEFKTVPIDRPPWEHRVQVNANDPDTRPAATLAEWCDDRILATGAHDKPEGILLFEILSAARQDGIPAAVAAVAGGRRLDIWQQWIAYQVLAAWDGKTTTAVAASGPLMAAIRAEWRRLGLRDEKPGQNELKRLWRNRKVMENGKPVPA
jgi:hypothetical protein